MEGSFVKGEFYGRSMKLIEPENKILVYKTIKMAPITVIGL